MVEFLLGLFVLLSFPSGLSYLLGYSAGEHVYARKIAGPFGSGYFFTDKVMMKLRNKFEQKKSQATRQAAIVTLINIALYSLVTISEHHESIVFIKGCVGLFVLGVTVTYFYCLGEVTSQYESTFKASKSLVNRTKEGAVGSQHSRALLAFMNKNQKNSVSVMDCYYVLAYEFYLDRGE